ncbi:uncharacterized protein MELLADRAFT_113665 [Melampsora larici-populina 98AG31]|uniref:Uncharacterized protein n=1 Tax=Melampsora larici-populina (strain 98AG31 / pathotype 3-4-7) TaxID=747676 RepID=F4SAP0_MELLP|nr:uncharacterized protein MELLADRAFT_113665 [Melampsora larici-populina 98AG31]EGF98301.1 hypothetical protein MELLADRAFT_113665 [Melampsora larici-populina 98AG31]
MQPGLCSNPTHTVASPPVSSSDSPHDASGSEQSDNHYQPPPQRQGQNTTAKRGGHTGSCGGGRKIPRKDQGPEEDTNITLPKPSAMSEDKLGNRVNCPTIDNYRQLGLQWGLPHAEHILSKMTLPKNNRPSSTGLFEAQALQSMYQLDKTMLCIVLKCSCHILDEALLEGPLAREPNMYTNYQTYSVVATQTKMPSKGVSEGFNKRNVIVGNTWSSYTEEEQQVFSPKLFERLCVATSKAHALTQTPHGIPSIANGDTMATPSPEDIPNKSDLQPLSEEELVYYIPLFKCLVNLGKVLGDLREGWLWRHSTKSRIRTREQLMQLEINKVAHQMPVHLRPKQDKPNPLSDAGIRQAAKHTELTQALNSLIDPFLCGGHQGMGDAHPKMANLKEAFHKKTYQGNVQLMFDCMPESLVTDSMIAKGASRLSNN